jgi:MOSC domain-containing protein YiiM
MMASIYSIVYQPVGQGQGDPHGEYFRVPTQTARLVAGHGIEGDQKAGHHPNRQLNLLSLEWLQGLQSLGYKTGPGQFGEQIILTGLAVESLVPGSRLQLGLEACIEVVKPRTGCTRFEAAQGKSVEGLGAIGVLAKVITSGTIRVGDPVKILEVASLE